MRDSMFLVCGASGVRQGLTGNHISRMLLERGFPVRALIHKDDESCDKLRALGARIVEGDCWACSRSGARWAVFYGPISRTRSRKVRSTRTAIFAATAREAAVERVVNLS